MKIGILAIQGDFSLQRSALLKLNIKSDYIRKEDDLNDCDALIIPGGESTTISLLMDKFYLKNPIINFSKKHNVFGICAGSILMSNNSFDSRINNLSIINLNTSRNSWGSQIHSFTGQINLNVDKFKKNKISGTFIRAPKFKDIATDNIVLGSFENEPVLIRNKKHLVCSFHPEINMQLCIYEYFIKMINE